MTAQSIAAVCDEAAALRPQAAAVPLTEILRLLDRARSSWQDPGREPRKSAAEALVRETGLPPAMVDGALDHLVALLEPARLRRRVQLELAGYPRLGDFSDGAGSPALWAPLGVVLHVLPNSGFALSALTLIEGLLAGNVNLLRPSSDAPCFLSEFIRSLERADTGGIVRRSVAVLPFPSERVELVEGLKGRVDGVVVWGGEAAVRAYRDGLPAGVRLVQYGPKLSLAVVTARGLGSTGVSRAAERLARDVVAGDQESCRAAQVCFVEEGGNAEELARALRPAMEELATRLPARPRDLHEASELRSWRMLEEAREAMGESLLVAPESRLDWAVTVDRASKPLGASPLRRTIRLLPYSDAGDISRLIAPWRGYIQTVGLLTEGAELDRYRRELAEAGALRIVSLGRMSSAAVQHIRDGLHPLQQLSRLVVVEEPEA